MSEQHKKQHPEQELDILKYWDETDAFQKSIDTRPVGDPYVFYDGPPFATGLPHYGHLIQSITKDAVPRFWTMKGKRVERTWGWDCHGLPIENIVEKKFDLGTRKEIEAFGVDAFNNKCHEEVLTYVEEWKKVIKRLGRWVDMESAYKTMDLPFMESVWWVFKSLWDKGLIYEGYKSMHVCPRCETVLSNFEVNQGYSDMTDISVYASFTLTSGDYAGAKMIAWTTTPWTLPGNVLLAVGPELAYVLIESGGESYLIAKDRLKHVRELVPDATVNVLEEIHGSRLIGATYEPLFPFFADHKNAFRVVGADFVTTQDGTGIVHIAPGFGEDDMNLGKEQDVEPILHVGMNGRFIDEVREPLLKEGYAVDRPVKEKEEHQAVDIEILKWLAHNGKLFAKKKIEHSYPRCWRCDTPLLNYATTSWFVRVTDLKDRLIATNKEINWVPGNIRDGRFGKGLESAPDWAISRSRYWGTPLPIWRSDEGDILCVGSVEELKELTGLEKVDNLHKHFIDQIVIEKDGKTYRSIGDVLDCWFESGSMPYAQLHYPFENEQSFESGFPAEFIGEAQDQTRGWFYTLHVLANALFDMPAFKNVIVSGIVLAEDGKKMSKKLNNYPDPMEVMEKYGSDAVRFYFVSTPVFQAQNISFSEKDVDEVAKKFINILRNVLSFYQLYAQYDDGRDPSGTHVLDRWMLSRLNQTLQVETDAMEAYDLQTAARSLQTFVTDLSTWYVRRSRDRMKGEGEDRAEALATMRHCLETFSKMIAPFMPFLAEVVYQEIDGGFLGRADRLSVHLEDWPVPGMIDEDVLEYMGEARAIVSRVLDQREEAGRAVKQALAGMTITTPSGVIGEELLQVLLDEVNVKTAVVERGELAVELDLELTPELLREGMAREVTRKVNALRKQAGLTIEDRIDLKVFSSEEEGKRMVQEHESTLKENALASAVTFEKDESRQHTDVFRVSEVDFWVGF